MGYTHYWEFTNTEDNKQYQTALIECRRIIRDSPVLLAGWDGTGKPELRNGFNFNGAGDDAGETFAMGKVPNGGDWYCKTNRAPYDVIVVACLCVLQDRLGSQISVGSDGDPDEWEDGRSFAQDTLNRNVSIPQDVIDQTGMKAKYVRVYREKHPEYKYTPLSKSHPE